jgi:hypothetical protein
MFSKGASIVYSIELPCHGNDAENNQVGDPIAFVNYLQSELEPKVRVSNFTFLRLIFDGFGSTSGVWQDGFVWGFQPWWAVPYEALRPNLH